MAVTALVLAVGKADLKARASWYRRAGPSIAPQSSKLSQRPFQWMHQTALEKQVLLLLRWGFVKGREKGDDEPFYNCSFGPCQLLKTTQMQMTISFLVAKLSPDQSW